MSNTKYIAAQGDTNLSIAYASVQVSMFSVCSHRSSAQHFGGLLEDDLGEQTEYCGHAHQVL